MKSVQEEIGSAELMREAERVILLRTVDSKWMDHIDIMDDLRDSIGMRGYAQHDPVVEYRKEGFTMFEAMNQGDPGRCRPPDDAGPFQPGNRHSASECGEESG